MFKNFQKENSESHKILTRKLLTNNGNGIPSFGLVFIPPLATDINISDHIPQVNTSEYINSKGLDPNFIPANFNWRDNGDSEKRMNITKPVNQMTCASCWAVASATVISDNFVVSGLMKNNPNISITHILSCPELKQNQCSGGNPALLLKTLGEKNIGLVSNQCIDYSWCAKITHVMERKESLKQTLKL